MTNVKESNFELVKILAMLMIVCHHLVTQNAFNIDTDLTGINPSRVFLQLIGNHAFVGNNLFFMVSAWHLCTKTELFQFKNIISRIWRLEKVMLFYSIGITVLFLFLPASIGGGNYLHIGYLLPISTDIWWYPTSYVIFLVFYPFYQQGLQSLQEGELKKLIIVMVCLWTLPTVIPMKLQLGANNTTCFFMIYALIFYVRKFSPRWAANPKVYKWMSLGGYAIAFLSILALDVIGTHIKSVNDYACYYIRGDWRIMPVVISVGLFLWSTQWKMGYRKIYNWMGELTFAVYLIHMHPLMIKLLFKKIFIIEPYVNSWFIVPYTIGITLFIFFACTLIDQMRKWLYLGVEKVAAVVCR